jgi:ribosomal protein S18 acetylase RimI-like enzyme
MGCAGTKVAPSPELEDGEIVSLTAADRWEVSKVIGRSFGGTAAADPEWGFHWALGPGLADRSDPAARAELLGWMISCDYFGKTRLRYIGVRGPTGELQAVCVFYRSPGGKKGAGSDMCGLMSHLSKHPPPPSFKANKFVETRLKEMDKVMTKSHKAHAAMPHWYTLTVGVDPPCQGSGLGAKLMRAVSKLADEAGEACYLETSGQRNREWYEHLGYEVKECFTLGPVPKDVPDYEPYKEFYGMVRPSKGS